MKIRRDNIEDRKNYEGHSSLNKKKNYLYSFIIQ